VTTPTTAVTKAQGDPAASETRWAKERNFSFGIGLV
jgi:hypothetical protein